MNMKRWFAILGAAILLGVSIFVNTLSSAFSTDWTALMDEFASVSSTNFFETVIEEGSLNERVVLLKVDGTIQDTGSASTFLEQKDIIISSFYSN